MALNTFFDLIVPDTANKVGPSVDVSTLSEGPTMVTSGPGDGDVILEISCDGGVNFAPVTQSQIPNPPTKVLVSRTKRDIADLQDGRPTGTSGVVAQFARIRRQAGSGASSVSLGAPIATKNLFANLNFAPVSTANMGPIKTICACGTYSGSAVVEGSVDGVNYDAVALFDTGHSDVRCIEGSYLKMRLRPGSASPSGSVSVGAGFADAGSIGTGVLQFDSIRVVGTKLSEFGTAGLPKGTVSYVGNDDFPVQSSVHDYFTLVYGENLDEGETTVVNSPTFADDGAQWLRQNVVNQQFISQLFVSLDPSNSSGIANDENTGYGTSVEDSDLRPLRTWFELNRRLKGFGDVGLTIHIMSASDSSNFTVLTNLASDGGSLQYVTIIGDLIPVDSNASSRLITAVQPAVPATNTERTIRIAGLGNAPQYVGMLVQTADGVKTSAITRQLEADLFAVGQVRDGNIYGVTGSIADFEVGDVVSIYDATPLPDWPFPANVPRYPILARVRLDLGDSGVFAIGQVGLAQAGITQVIFGSDDNPSKCAIISGACDQGNAPFVWSCAMRKRHVMISGSWNFLSVAVCLNGAGANTGDGPRLSDAVIYIQDELNISGSGSNFVSEGGPWSLVAMRNSQIATFGLSGPGFLLGLNDTLHAIGGGIIDCASPLKWYGTNPSLVAGPGSLGLLNLGPGINRIPFDPSLLTVTVGGSGKRVAILNDGAKYDFSDVPLQSSSGAFLGGGNSDVGLNRGKTLVGGDTCVSYGNQSPENDAVKLSWNVGDKRIYAGPPVNSGVSCYVCTVAGTPGTWTAQS